MFGAEGLLQGHWSMRHLLMETHGIVTADGPGAETRVPGTAGRKEADLAPKALAYLKFLL